MGPPTTSRRDRSCGPGHGVEACCDPSRVPTRRSRARASPRPDARGDRERLSRRRERFVILVDSNVPMYLIGADREHRDRARRALEEAVAAGEPLCTDVEVLQEILHRFRAIRREASIDAAFDIVIGVVDVVYPIEQADVERARRLLRTTP